MYVGLHVGLFSKNELQNHEKPTFRYKQENEG